MPIILVSHTKTPLEDELATDGQLSGPSDLKIRVISKVLGADIGVTRKECGRDLKLEGKKKYSQLYSFQCRKQQLMI
ncbi:hypothetical protein FRX31_007507 [Thalictrum thalictroides]|uniref:Uncharacterized protein n=1 Tax=Thalictrum thalictroides TaxID=46969 RepID=A0A7J6X2J1_THATH|nr:hypothetical protein FRX31_007507 [Thalictrum thalictroides]